MAVKEPRDLSLELDGLLQIRDGTCVVEQFPLDFPGKSIPPHDHRGPEASQNLFLFHESLIALLRRCQGQLAIACQPFFVFSASEMLFRSRLRNSLASLGDCAVSARAAYSAAFMR
jgi:hypothetical protein